MAFSTTMMPLTLPGSEHGIYDGKAEVADIFSLPLSDMTRPIPQSELMALHHWASLKTELLWAYEDITDPNHCRLPGDYKRGYSLWLIRQGSGEVEMNGKTWQVKAGQWIALPQGVSIQRFADDSRILSVHFRCEWPTGENFFSLPDAWVFEAQDFPRLEQTAFHLCSLVNRFFPGMKANFSLQTVEYSVFFEFQMLFEQWLYVFFETWTSQGKRLAKIYDCDERLLRCVRYLNGAPFERGFSAQSVERESGLGRAHLDRLFLKQFGVTTREYWERRRKEAAMQALEMEVMSIKEIGYQLGFKRSSHFTKWFTHRTEMTPSAYRKRILKRNLP
jgi:AraC-like DNA-binding protein